MREDVSVYDLGEIRTTRGRRTGRARTRPARLPATRPRTSLPAWAGSLSLVLPGAGHLVLREPVAALFFASTFGFAVSLAWALSVRFGSLARTLELLGISPSAAAAGLASSAALAAALHVSAVVVAVRDGSREDEPGAPPGVLAGLASALVPGWGQVLAGRPAAAAVFLSLAWALLLAWGALTPAAQALLRPAGFALPRVLLEGWGPVALVVATTLVWAVGFTDAAAGAARRRS